MSAVVAGIACYAVLFVVWFGVVMPRSIRKQDRLWREHREEQRRLDREHREEQSRLDREHRARMRLLTQRP